MRNVWCGVGALGRGSHRSACAGGASGTALRGVSEGTRPACSGNAFRARIRGHSQAEGGLPRSPSLDVTWSLPSWPGEADGHLGTRGEKHKQKLWPEECCLATSGRKRASAGPTVSSPSDQWWGRSSRFEVKIHAQKEAF